jgi:hypothetical protein
MRCLTGTWLIVPTNKDGDHARLIANNHDPTGGTWRFLMRLFLAALAVVLVLPVLSGCWKQTSCEETRRDANVDQILGPAEGAANISEGDGEEA